MALLDPLPGGLPGVSSSPFRGVLMIVLGPSGVLAELLSSFEQAGLGHAAGILVIPVGTVRSRLSRGRDALRKLFDMEGRPSAIALPQAV